MTDFARTRRGMTGVALAMAPTVANDTATKTASAALPFAQVVWAARGEAGTLGAVAPAGGDPRFAGSAAALYTGSMNARDATPHTNRLGIQAMLASQAFFSVSDTMVKLSTSSLPPGEIMAVRGVFGTAIVIGLFFATGAHLHWRALAHPMVALRAAIEGAIAVMFVSAIGRMQMGNYTAILLASPLIITAMAALLFRAAVGWRRWSAIGIGFGGVLCVAQPSAAGIDWATWLAIGLAFLVAIRDLVTRGVPGHVPSMLVTLATTVVTTGIGLAMTAGGVYVTPDAGTVLRLAIAAGAVSMANLFVIMATRKADVAVVAPFRFSVMPFALLSGFFVWGNVPDALAMLGIVLICGSGLYAIHRERVQRQALAAR